MARKKRKCPKCKSSKGVRIKYIIQGSGWEEIDFQGNVLDCDREMSDKIDSYAICLNCGTHIDIDLINNY